MYYIRHNWKLSYHNFAKDTCYHVPDALWLFRHIVKRPELLSKIVEVSVVAGQIQIFGARLRMETLSKRKLSVRDEPQRMDRGADVKGLSCVVLELQRKQNGLLILKCNFRNSFMYRFFIRIHPVVLYYVKYTIIITAKHNTSFVFMLQTLANHQGQIRLAFDNSTNYIFVLRVRNVRKNINTIWIKERRRKYSLIDAAIRNIPGCW